MLYAFCERLEWCYIKKKVYFCVLIVERLFVFSMDATMFSKLLQGNCTVDESVCRQVNDACSRYPYCAPLQLLSFQVASLMGDADGVDAMRTRAEFYLFDRRCLQQPLLQCAKSVPEVDVDVLKEINAYHEVSFKTAPKSVILSHFLETADVNLSVVEESTVQSVEDLGKKSVLHDDSICTETWALVLAGQGKNEEAISVYQQLMQKYPEKSATFANCIKALSN